MGEVSIVHAVGFGSGEPVGAIFGNLFRNRESWDSITACSEGVGYNTRSELVFDQI